MMMRKRHSYDLITCKKDRQIWWDSLEYRQINNICMQQLRIFQYICWHIGATYLFVDLLQTAYSM